MLDVVYAYRTQCCFCSHLINEIGILSEAIVVVYFKA